MPAEPTHPNWTPHPIVTRWDDLTDGIKSAADWERKRRDVKKRFLELIRDEAAPPVPRDLDVRTEWEQDGDGFSIRRISYNVEADERAHAFLAVPSGPAPAGGFPAVLCIHGTRNWGREPQWAWGRSPAIRTPIAVECREWITVACWRSTAL